MEFDGFGNVAEIRGDGDFDAFGVEAETDRIDGVVRDTEAIHIDIADGEAGAGLKAFQTRPDFAPIDRRRGELADVNRNPQAASQARETGDVIGMFVGDQDRMERFD